MTDICTPTVQTSRSINQYRKSCEISFHFEPQAVEKLIVMMWIDLLTAGKFARQA